MSFNTHTAFLGLYLLAAVTLSSTCFGAEPAGKSKTQTEADLLAQLQDESASFQDKSVACERLAVIGTEAAVPVLSSLLDTKKLAHYARYALEPIPSDQVDAALIASLDTLKEKHLMGVIQSIANRGDPAAIDALAEKLDDSDRGVAKMAAHAIARLGTAKASKVLSEHLSSEFAVAALVCGKQLARQGHKDLAIAMFTKLTRLRDIAEHIHLAAMLQIIQLQGPEGLDLLMTALSSDDEKQRNQGFRTARLIDQADAAKVARKVLKNADPSRTAALLTLLGDLDDKASLPAVIDAIGSDHESIQAAALGAMASLGSAEHVSLLIDAATGDSRAATVALETLATLPGKDVDEAVLGLFDDKLRQDTVIRLIGKRRISAAVPKLIAMIDAPNRLEVVAALGETISLDELDILGKRLNSKPEDFNLAIQKALHAACDRMPNRSATVAKLLGYMEGASDVTVQLVMDELRQIGGPEALAAVVAGTKSDLQVRREYATRALGNWLDTSPASALLELAQTEGSSKYGIRGIRGYIRLARQFSMSEAERMAMCRTALQTAQRTDDKKLVLAILERYASLESLKVTVRDAAAEPEMKESARQSAQRIANKIKSDKAAANALLAEIAG